MKTLTAEQAKQELRNKYIKITTQYELEKCFELLKKIDIPRKQWNQNMTFPFMLSFFYDSYKKPLAYSNFAIPYARANALQEWEIPVSEILDWEIIEGRGVDFFEEVKKVGKLHEKQFKVKSTIQYLIDNDLFPDTGLLFTCNDYDFIKENNFEEITINEGKKNREEKLTLPDIVLRMRELYNFVKLFEGRTITSSFDMDKIKGILQKEQ